MGEICSIQSKYWPSSKGELVSFMVWYKLNRKVGRPQNQIGHGSKETNSWPCQGLNQLASGNLTDWANPPHTYKLTFQYALTLKHNTSVHQLQCFLTIQVCSLVCLSTVSLRSRSHCCCILSRSRWRLRVSLLPLPLLRWADRESMSWPLLSSMITSCSLLITSLYIG